MVSVKTAAPIPKGKIFEAMELIRSASVEAPVKIGDVILPDVFGTTVVATKDIG
jgi:CxxC motif-containing protein